MNYFCTYCDQGYAARMCCLYDSLREQGEPFRLWVLCFDAATEAVVKAQGDAALVAVPLGELLAADPEYTAVRAQRTRVEFYFTSTPVLLRHCFRREPAAESVTYLDADLFFFAPASEVFAEQGGASVGIVPHRFPPHLADRAVHGTYNVGWVSFRRDVAGLGCLEWWRERCLEWCHERLEAGRFADQGYLDEFPQRFTGVASLQHPGVNAAPWNIDPTSLRECNGRPSHLGRPIIFYHYQGIREVEQGWFDPGLGTYRVPLTPALREILYRPYLRRLAAKQAQLSDELQVESARGYLRIPTGASWSERWERWRAGRASVLLRRIRGRLIHCPAPAARATA